jgi:NTP pyrophosphatase (non-canonical NTP hydrolase)
MFLPGTFISAFQGVAEKVNENAISKGWWKGERNEAELIALMHSELSEALEGLRHGNPASDHIPQFSAVEEEFADVIIRIMDHAFAKNYRVAEALVAKMEFNLGREFMHGGKKF